MGSVSIWTLDERKGRFGLVLNEQRLGYLRKKRVRQLKNLIEKRKVDRPGKVHRLIDVLASHVA